MFTIKNISRTKVLYLLEILNYFLCLVTLFTYFYKMSVKWFFSYIYCLFMYLLRIVVISGVVTFNFVIILT